MKWYSKIVDDWKAASIIKRIAFISIFSLQVASAVFITRGFMEYDKVSGLWVSDTNWTVGIILFTFATLLYILNSKFRVGK